MVEVLKPDTISRPDNLMNRSWGGSLAATVIRRKQRTFLIVAAIITAIAFGTGGGVYLFTGEQVHMLAAFPIGVWLSSLSVPIVHKFNVRRLYVFRKMTTGAWELDESEWFKSDIDQRLDENDALYMNGRRVHWTVETPSGYRPLRPWEAREINEPTKPGAEPVTAAHIASIQNYLEAVQNYAYKKTQTINDVVKIGALGIIIGVVLLGIYMMSGRLRDEPVNASTSQETAGEQSSAGPGGQPAGQ